MGRFAQFDTELRERWTHHRGENNGDECLFCLHFETTGWPLRFVLSRTLRMLLCRASDPLPAH